MIAVPLQPEWRTATATFCTPFARVQKYRTKLYHQIHANFQIFQSNPIRVRLVHSWAGLGHVTVTCCSHGRNGQWEKLRERMKESKPLLQVRVSMMENVEW